MPPILEDTVLRCVCGARSVYRLTLGGHTRYCCAACANSYPSPPWEAELLPAFRIYEEQDVYEHYSELRRRLPSLAPELLGTLERFRGRVEQLEARYQREHLAGRRRSA